MTRRGGKCLRLGHLSSNRPEPPLLRRIGSPAARTGGTVQRVGATVETSETEVAFNLAYRILGSEADAAEATRQALGEASRRADGEQPFALQLFIATRRACHDLMSRQRRPLPAEAMPASAEPSEEAIAAASMRLPIRQREALALRELGRLPYGEIATVIEASPNAVAQLISRARINLSDELRGTVLASIAAPSPECERALPLIAMREDGQLEADSRDAAWLDAHLSGCERCRLGVGAMREAGASYGSWAPIAAASGLLDAAGAKAAAELAADAGLAPRPAPQRSGPSRKRPILAAGLAAMLLLVGLAVAAVYDDPAAPPLDPAADAAPSARTAAPKSKERARAKEKAAGSRRTKQPKAAGGGSTQAGAAETAAASEPATVPVTSEGSSPGAAAIAPTQKRPASKPSPSPKPVPTTAAAPQPAPVPAPAPVAEEPAPVAEEPASEPPRRREPPGKPAGKPSK
jgi:DNA-directed RNA polymerase specialized sigma24 family protein